MRSWLSYSDYIASHTCDIKQVKNYVERLSRHNLYMVRSIETSQVSYGIKRRSILRAFDNEITDLEIFAFANDVHKNVWWDKKEKKVRIEYSLATNRAEYWVMDIDRGPESIELLIEIFKKRKCFLPRLIVQTGPNSFHCLYGKKGNNWDKESIWKIISTYTGLIHVLNEENKIYREVVTNDYGIDWKYSINNPFHVQKYRVPGSLNKKYINKDGSLWKCIGWENKEYVCPFEEWGREKGEKVNIPDCLGYKLVEIGNKRKGGKKYNKTSYVGNIRRLLGEIYKDGLGVVDFEKLAELLSGSAGWLAGRICRINQVWWAERLGVSQKTVSRLIHKLVRDKIIEVVNNKYVPGRSSKVYGAGERLLPEIGYVGVALPRPDWNVWEKGTSWERMRYDVRYYMSLGWKDHEIVDKLVERESGRMRSKRRGRRQILKCVQAYRKWIINWMEMKIGGYVAVMAKAS